MKIKLMAWLRTSRRILTEVPGWPDAPVGMQLRRAMPVLVPCAAMVLLLDWQLLVHAPRVREQRTALAPLVALETEVETLKIACSGQQVEELAAGAALASRLLIDAPAALPDFLAALKTNAAGHGWEANFVAADVGGSVPFDGAVVGYLPVRAKMVPLPGNADVFGSFVELMARFSGSEKRIDLIRLSVRADEDRWQLVELNFRLAYPLHR